MCKLQFTMYICTYVQTSYIKLAYIHMYISMCKLQFTMYINMYTYMYIHQISAKIKLKYINMCNFTILLFYKYIKVLLMFVRK